MSEHPGGALPAPDRTSSTPPAPRPASAWSPWRAVAGFGTVSLGADMVYEGARSITGPLLASLGASAVLVGLVTGAGEAAALLLRLVFGSMADRFGSYWALTIGGYVLTAVCVPALAVTPFLGGAGLAVACVLLLAERTGKAVRSPAKSALLAHVAGAVGLGRGFAVHKALDQVGAFSGPLLVAAVAALTGALWPAMAVLALPGAAAVGLLMWMRARIDDGSADDRGAPSVRRRTAAPVEAAAPLPRRFWFFAGSAGLSTAGLVTFGVISFHLVHERVFAVAVVPVVYAAAMAAAAIAALVTGWLYDRINARVLIGLPALITAVPVLAFSNRPGVAVTGVLLWGAAVGVQDSTVKALVAELVPAARRATAYGLFAAVQGGAAIAGGTTAGALYSSSVPALVAAVAGSQVVALLLLGRALRAAGRPAPGVATR